ncbi:uncharacterized protein [Spinacia oleracea]|uniref:Integrase catalytic domain-containing protein n=1 Tax=Spinacia oleracea TaxID=3562 RepID=A0ABM3R8B6_SPIOL|nr:uncharacterized protein LOC130467369 [Spinacia oleracea]
MTRKCEKCQKFAPKKWLIVGVDYFSKWIEAEAISAITEAQVRKFIWQNIITRFGIPRLMVFDDRKQFDNTSLQSWCKQFSIHIAYSAVCHPQSNGQAEAANKLIFNALKKRVEDEKRKFEAVIPIDISTEILRIQSYNKYDEVHGEGNDQLLSKDLYLLDEARDDARTLNAAYQQRVRKHYNRRVNATTLKVGDLVLRNATAVQKGRIHGKLSATWEGPYIIHTEKRPGTYMLRKLDGQIWKNHWNANVLKKYFVKAPSFVIQNLEKQALKQIFGFEELGQSKLLNRSSGLKNLEKQALKQIFGFEELGKPSS